MAQVTLSIRMDEDVKKQFDNFCAEIGMNASVAVNMFARAVIREKRIPNELTYIKSNHQTSTPSILNLDKDVNWVDQLTGIISLPEGDKHKNVKDIISEGLWEDYANLV